MQENTCTTKITSIKKRKWILSAEKALCQVKNAGNKKYLKPSNLPGFQRKAKPKINLEKNEHNYESQQ